MKVGKAAVKLGPFADDMVFTESPKESKNDY